MAHKYVRNMLDSSMHFDNESDNVLRKQELTLDDLNQLIDNAEHVWYAAVIARRIKFKK